MNSTLATVDSTRAAGLPAALIYTHSLLAGSMTFIKSHAEALREYRPIYVGAHRVRGLELPSERTHVLNKGTCLGAAREYLFRRFGAAPGLVRALKARNPGVIHAHFGTSGPAGLALAMRLGVPLVVTFHGKDATIGERIAKQSRRGRELLRGRHAMIARVDAFIAVSGFVRRQLLEQGYPENRVILHRNGIDLDYFKPNEQGREPIIVFVGRFVEKKGVEYLIKAARVLQSKKMNFRLLLIGDGPLRRDLEQAVRRHEIDAEFTGFLALDDVRVWLNRASVVAVPSVTAADGDSEGLPTIVLEAQAMSTPIVATRHSGIPEGVLEAETAELVEERDVDALAAALGSFLSSPDKQRAFGSAGRRFVSEHFDLNDQVRGLEALYGELRKQYPARARARR